MTAGADVAPHPPSELSPGQAAVLKAIVLGGLAIVPFLPTLRGPFFWDDGPNIEINRALRSRAGLGAIWTDPLASFQYYPITYSLFWTEFQLFGERPAGYHAVSLLLHTANAALLWRTLLLLRAPAAWWVAALFAVHPIQVETVGWITEQKNLLSTFFSLVAIQSWERFARGGRISSYGAATLSFVAALASKTVVVVLPVWLMLAEATLRRSPLRRWLPALLVWIAVGIGAGKMTSWRETASSVQTGVPANTPPSLRLDERVLLAAQSLWRYVGMFFYLEPLVPIPVRSAPSWSNPSAVASLIGAGMVGATAIALAMRGQPRLLLGLSFFALQLAPTLGFVPFQFQCLSFVADHFAYFACAGFFAAMCGALFSIPSSGRRTMGSALLLVLCLLTWRQSSLFADPERLWAETVKVNPAAWAAYTHLSDLQMKRHALPEALDSARHAVSAEPTNAVAHANLGLALDRLGRTADAEAPLQEAVRLAPHDPRFHHNLGFVLLKQERWREALVEFQLAAEQAADFPMTHWLMGVAYRRLGRTAEARTAFKRALEIDRDLVQARQALAELDAAPHGQSK